MPTLKTPLTKDFAGQKPCVLPQQPHYLTLFVTPPRWFGVDA